MPLRPIVLGPDVPATHVFPPYRPGDTIQSDTAPFPMGNGVSILVVRMFRPDTGASATIARAFTVNPDGTQNWGPPLTLPVVTAQSGHGVALDATRALVVVYDSVAGAHAWVLTLNGLTLTAGPTSGVILSVVYGAHTMVVMNPSTVLLMGNAIVPGGAIDRRARVQRLDISGTSVIVDNTKAFNWAEDPSIITQAIVKLDDLTAAAFWTADSPTSGSYWGLVQLDGPFIADVSFGGNLFFANSVYVFEHFREIHPGFVLAVGTKPLTGKDQAVATMIEFGEAAHLLLDGPVVELTATNPASDTLVDSFPGTLTIAGHQAVVTYPAGPFVDGFGTGIRVVELNLGTAFHEIKEIGYKDMFPGAAVVPFGLTILPSAVAVSPRRTFHIYKVNGGFELERAFYADVPLVDPLRWRQRDDCLTPGSAFPCICFTFDQNVGLFCIPSFQFWLTSSVQFGGRVGPLNTYY